MKSIFGILLVTATSVHAAEKTRSFEQYVQDEKEDAEVTLKKPQKTGTGVVTEAIHTADYSYIEVKTDSGSMWLATTKTDVKPGAKVSFKYDGAIDKFESKTLKRTFTKIFFVEKVSAVSDKAADESLLATIIKNRESLAGSLVTVTGRVTKVNQKILGKNWIHITDKSLQQLGQDITITTDKVAKVGQTLTAEGVLAADKDFGSGYFFTVIIEDAKIKLIK